MAATRNHRRRRGSAGGGPSWISYSDMMAALVLVFVLILCVSLYRYFTMLEAKTRELETQQAALLTQQLQLDEKDAALISRQNELDEANAVLAASRLLLLAQEASLTDLQASLSLREGELQSAYAELTSKEAQLAILQASVARQQAQLDNQASEIRGLVGIRAQIIEALSRALADAHISAGVDPDTGEIMLDSAIFFEKSRSEIKDEGKKLLNEFIPVYLKVLLNPDYTDYLGAIIVEGHTDSSGSYLTNLKLSTERALAVANYIYSMPGLTSTQRTTLQKIMTATGRSFSDPVYYEGTSIENPDASRRVEFKFSLKDTDMIMEMNRLLQSGGKGGTP